ILDEGQDVVAQSLSSSILPDRLGQFAPRRSRKPCQLLHLRQAWPYRCAPLLCQPRKLIGLGQGRRSEEHTSELQSLMRTSYAGFCLTTQTNKDKQATWY